MSKEHTAADIAGPVKSDVVPSELEALMETLAANAHNRWMEGRIAEGWTYGEARDDHALKHPCLVPYGDLPESEKEYDRKAVRSAISSIIYEGYSIVPPEKPGSRLTRPLSSQQYAVKAEALRRDRNSYKAFDFIRAGLDSWPNDVRLRQLYGLVCADLNAPETAVAMLQSLYDEDHRDEETLGILGRVYKDMAGLASDLESHETHLRKSLGYYLQAFETLDDSYYTGINAATLSLVLGENEQAKRIARRVLAICDAVLGGPDSDSHRYYATATKGEALLILNDIPAAKQYYAEAIGLSHSRLRDVISMRKNAKLIVDALEKDFSLLGDLLNIPKVAIFTGHLADMPNASVRRFPPDPALEVLLRERFSSLIDDHDFGVVFSSAAAGGDILFLEAFRDKGLPFHIVLPMGSDAFLEQAVAYGAPGNWEARYHALVDEARDNQRLHIVSDWPIDETFLGQHYANQYLLGVAKLHANKQDSEIVPVALWDGTTGGGFGGTAHTVQWWQAMGLDVEHVELDKLVGQCCGPVQKSSLNTRSVAWKNGKTEHKEGFAIRSMLFADIVGYSKLSEAEVFSFVNVFMKQAAELADGLEEKPEASNEWGDALYYVFSSTEAAGQFALKLAEMVTGADWPRYGLPASLNIRIALHAGPVYGCIHPINGLWTFTGTHVSRAARVEPITPPGKVYATQAFAALSEAECVTGFSCEYMGVEGLAKGYGQLPLYRLVRVVSPNSIAAPVWKRGA